MKPYLKNNTYGFHFKGDYQSRVAGLHSVGKECRKEHTYIWKGLEREEYGRIVFQYTLSGEGCIKIGESKYTLKTGDAFMVSIPSNHCYFLPKSSDEWQFIYITIYGEEINKHYNQIVERYGNVFNWPLDCRPIKHILKVIEIIETTGINHGYDASKYAYAFMMECMQYLEYEQQQEKNIPYAIEVALEFIKNNFQNDISLDDIVNVSGLSKYHFTRLFNKTLSTTPIHYLSTRRIQEALELLKNTNLTIDEIAKKVGYTNSNYFSKVFKKYMGELPSKYRYRKSFMPVNRWFID